MNLSAFEAAGARDGKRPRRAPVKGPPPDVQAKRDKERALLARLYRIAMRAEREAIYADTGGAMVKGLIAEIKRQREPDEILSLVVASTDWLLRLPQRSRMLVLRAVDDVAIRARIEAGLAEFDDPLIAPPWREEPNLYQQVRTALEIR